MLQLHYFSAKFCHPFFDRIPFFPNGSGWQIVGGFNLHDGIKLLGIFYLFGKLMYSFQNVFLTYDKKGNPLSYYNGSSYTFSWTGRQLTGAVKGSNTMSFTYNVASPKQLIVVWGVAKPLKAKSCRSECIE